MCISSAYRAAVVRLLNPGPTKPAAMQEPRAGDDQSVGADALWPCLVLEDERHLHGDPILGNLAVGDACLLLEHMQSRDPTQRFAGAGQSLTHSVIEALR